MATVIKNGSIHIESVNAIEPSCVSIAVLSVDNRIST